MKVGNWEGPHKWNSLGPLLIEVDTANKRIQRENHVRKRIRKLSGVWYRPSDSNKNVDNKCVKTMIRDVAMVLDSVTKKSLKIPKGQSESVYRRRTDNTITRRKSTKGQTTIYKTYI